MLQRICARGCDALVAEGGHGALAARTTEETHCDEGVAATAHRIVVRSRKARYALNTSCNGCAVFTSV